MKMKNQFRKLAGVLMLALTLLMLRSAKAGLMVQTDTNMLAVASTNTFILAGDVSGSFTNGETISQSLITCKSGDDVWFSAGGFFTNSTANSSNVTFRVAQSVDGANWTNSATTLVLIVPGNTTNWVTVHQLIQNSAPIYGLRAIENANAAGVTAKAGTMYLKAFVKDGI